MMLFFARFFGDLWYITVIFFLLIIGTVMFLSMHPTGKELWQRLSLKIPVIGGIIEYAILERFCAVLGTMLVAGVAVPSAMETTTEAVANVVYREQLDIARQQMLEGSGFTQPLIETELFPGAARQMFKVGEETGTLDQQLEVAAEYFNRELEFRIERFTTMFEPIMIHLRRLRRRLRGDRARVGHVRRLERCAGRRVISHARSDSRCPGR